MSESTTIKKPRTPKTDAGHDERDTATWRKVGRRKRAIARVRLSPGNGSLLVNEKEYTAYFKPKDIQDAVAAPLTLVSMRSKLDVSARVVGGGFRGQAEAVRHGITRALIDMDGELKKTLRGAGYVTRDPRVKERKKPGLKRARRAPQWAKR
ncbi:30S ribosomal protein S9 [Candidatus Uhrbacteria bacterium]|nr:30S ribosomal protein S9 [Candidatus Uhrbacteria bacterium]